MNSKSTYTRSNPRARTSSPYHSDAEMSSEDSFGCYPFPSSHGSDRGRSPPPPQRPPHHPEHRLHAPLPGGPTTQAPVARSLATTLPIAYPGPLKPCRHEGVLGTSPKDIELLSHLRRGVEVWRDSSIRTIEARAHAYLLRLGGISSDPSLIARLQVARKMVRHNHSNRPSSLPPRRRRRATSPEARAGSVSPMGTRVFARRDQNGTERREEGSEKYGKIGLGRPGVGVDVKRRMST